MRSFTDGRSKLDAAVARVPCRRAIEMALCLMTLRFHPMHPQLSSANEALAWLAANDIRRVELVFADLTSVARGKIMSTASFA
jgi:hypothetical protein